MWYYSIPILTLISIFLVIKNLCKSHKDELIQKLQKINELNVSKSSITYDYCMICLNPVSDRTLAHIHDYHKQVKKYDCSHRFHVKCLNDHGLHSEECLYCSIFRDSINELGVCSLMCKIQNCLNTTSDKKLVYKNNQFKYMLNTYCDV